MMEYIHAADSLTGVLAFLGGVIFFVVLRPLNDTLVELKKSIEDLRNDLRYCEERRHALEIKLAEVDQRARALHERVDRLEGKKGKHDDLEHG